MKKTYLLSILFLIGYSNAVSAQDYDIIIKGGHVIDVKNNIDNVMDVAIKEGTIAKVAKSIDGKKARQVVEANGMYVTPGLIDIHEHVFFGTQQDHYLNNAFAAVPPDGFTFRVGVTTVVDCGSSGWKSFPTFKKNIVDRSETRVLAFLNIVGEGMRGGAYEQDTLDMDAKLSAGVARRYKEHIVGFKVAHYEAEDWIPIDRAVEAGRLAGDIPVIVDFGGSESHAPLSIEKLFFDHLRPGDIYTHAFTELDRREPIIDTKTRKLKSFVERAQERGIIFDVGFGGASFDYGQAIPAIKSGFFPNSISTDLHTGSMNAAMKDMLHVMSTFLTMGMDLNEVIRASTWAPAQEIKREELGNLSVGAPADIAILNLRKGNFGFWDRTGKKLSGTQKFECEMTVREGKIVYDLNGMANPVIYKNTN